MIRRLLIRLYIPVILNNDSCNYWVLAVWLTLCQVLDLQRFEPRFPDSSMHVLVTMPACLQYYPLILSPIHIMSSLVMSYLS